MSRIGKEPIKIEEGVTAKVKDKKVVVTGPKGELEIELPYKLSAEVKDDEIILSRKDDQKKTKSLHGTYRMIVANAVKGVKEGYEKKLELVGVGYRARLEGTTLVMTLGWNHPIKVEPYEGIEIEVPDETKITIRGIDKQKVGEFAAKVRSQREPEPYKGKGVRYADEYVRRKSSKTSLVAE
ncbi:MAG: 50S ribosomal protein L6P [candidate division WS6 bacterium 34_10]|jgi:large subunit ribosomal protein L6|uniref:Large ribosomal subunit protein uL6 n=1 Tax=candidate division WS6 bacterium 34_10 TaxID=1641389 RepID=A0A117M060_9BACT|nr:MAG: 50S ribosomal protein L6P [candidate division WS6 bacterium 34_10]